MSNLRNFSSEAYTQLCEVIDTGVGEYQFGDFLEHVFSSDINFDEYTGLLSDYYTKIVDKHSMDIETLKRIFTNVSMCDDEFREELSCIKDRVKKISSCISNLASIFEESDSYVFESKDFLDTNFELYIIKDSITQYYFKLFYHNEDLNVEAIAKVMNMDPSNVSEEQIEALVLVLSDVICQEDGLINTELLEEFMRGAYVIEEYYFHQTTPNGLGEKIYEVKLSEVLDKVKALFSSKVNTELKAGGWDLFFDDVSFGQERDTQAYLTSKMTMAEILEFMRDNYSKIEIQADNFEDISNKKLPSIEYVNADPGYYHISFTPYNQSQQDSYIFDFNKLVYTAMDQMLNININDDKRNFIDELFSKWFDFTCDEAWECAEDGVYEALEFTAEASALVGFIGDSINEIWNLYKEIEESNAAIEELSDMENFQRFMKALVVGGTLVATNINAPNNTLLYDIHNLTFNREKLTETVNNYNNYVDGREDFKKNLTSEDIEKLKVDVEKFNDYLEEDDLYNIDLFKYYLSWYLSTGGDTNNAWHPNI